MIIRITNYDYYNIFDNEYEPEFIGPVLVITGREKDGKFRRIRCLDEKLKPHFYVEDTKENRHKLITHSLSWEPVDYPAIYDEDEKVIKVYVQFPYEVTHYRKFFAHTYNSNVKWAELAMMTLQLPNGFIEIPDDADWVKFDEIKPVAEEDTFFVKIRILYYDIETEMIDPEEDFSAENSKIISIVAYDNYANCYHTFEWSDKNTGWWNETRVVERSIDKYDILPKESGEGINHYPSEKELLKGFFEIFPIIRPDGLMGFNSHGGNLLKSYKSETRREWSNGFDDNTIYLRAMINGLHKEMQQMSPLPRYKNKWGRYYGVYSRGRDPKLEVVIRCLTPLDVMFDIPKMGYIDKYRDFFGGGLGDYLEYFAGLGKVGHVGMTVAEFKEFDLYKELEYNRRDVEGLIFLDEYFGYHNDIFERVSIIQTPGIDLQQSTKIHNFLTLKYSQNKVVYDSKWQDFKRDIWPGWLVEKKDIYGIVTKKKKNRAGGYVVEVDRGAHGMTFIMDFSRLYPNLLIAANVGLDTLVSVKEEHDDYFIDFKGNIIKKEDCNITPAAPFLKEHIKKAVDAQIWEDLIGFRDVLKQRMKEILDSGADVNSREYKLVSSKEYNLKQGVLNNKFGSMGNKGYIGFSEACYNVAPSMGQVLIRGLAEDFLPSLGYYAIAGDTDSVMPNLKAETIEQAKEEAEWLIKKANVYIKERMKRIFNIETDKTILDWEKIGPFFYAHAKKNYLLEVWAQDGKILSPKERYIMYKGFQLKKLDRSIVTELVQKAYFKIAKRVTVNNLNYREEMGMFIIRLETIFPLLSWEKICSRINLKRKLNRYAVNFMNRRAAEFSNERFGTNFTNGSRGFLAFRKIQGSSTKMPVMMFRKEDIPKIRELGYEIDYDWHLQKFVKDKVNYLFEDYGLGWNSLKQTISVSSVMVI